MRATGAPDEGAGRASSPHPPEQERLRRPVWLGLMVIAAATSIASYMIITLELALGGSRFAADFLVFWTAGQAAQPYDFAMLTAAQQWYAGSEAVRPFAYPPSFLPWVVPFGMLPMLPAFFLWTLVTLGLFAFAWSQIVRPRLVLVALAAPTVLLAAIPGQVVFLLGAMLVSALAVIDRRPILAGVLLGLAATIKPQTLLLVPLALAAGQHWRALAAAGLTGAAIGAACLAGQGTDLWLQWADALPSFMATVREGGMIHFGITPSSSLERAGIEGVPAIAILAGAGALALLTVWMVFRASRDVATRILALNAATLLILPYAMPYELALCAPAATAMLLDRDRHTAATLAALLVLTVVADALSMVAMCAALIWALRTKAAPASRATPAPQPA